MSINKNDCLDCGNLVWRDSFNPNSLLYCKATNKDLGHYDDLDVFEGDCPDFKYEE